MRIIIGVMSPMLALRHLTRMAAFSLATSAVCMYAYAAESVQTRVDSAWCVYKAALRGLDPHMPAPNRDHVGKLAWLHQIVDGHDLIITQRRFTLATEYLANPVRAHFWILTMRLGGCPCQTFQIPSSQLEVYLSRGQAGGWASGSLCEPTAGWVKFSRTVPGGDIDTSYRLFFEERVELPETRHSVPKNRPVTKEVIAGTFHARRAVVDDVREIFGYDDQLSSSEWVGPYAVVTAESPTPCSPDQPLDPETIRLLEPALPGVDIEQSELRLTRDQDATWYALHTSDCKRFQLVQTTPSSTPVLFFTTEYVKYFGHRLGHMRRVVAALVSPARFDDQTWCVDLQTGASARIDEKATEDYWKRIPTNANPSGPQLVTSFQDFSPDDRAVLLIGRVVYGGSLDESRPLVYPPSVWYVVGAKSGSIIRTYVGKEAPKRWWEAR